MKKPQITVRFNETGEQTEVVAKKSNPVPKNEKIKGNQMTGTSLDQKESVTDQAHVNEQIEHEEPKFLRRKRVSESPFYLINEDDLSRLTQEESKAEVAAASERRSTTSSIHLEDSHYNIKFYDEEDAHQIEIDERIYNDSSSVKRSNGKSSYPFMVYSKKNIFSSMRNYHFPKLVATVAGAVITGCLLGYLVLFLFFNPIGGKESVPTTGNGQNGTSQNQPQNSGQSGQTPVIDPNASVSPKPILNGTKLTVPVSTFYVVQGGVFQEKSGAELALQTQLEKGWGGLVTPVAPYRLFVGVTSTKEQAEPLKSFYTTQGIEVYVKEWTIGAKEVELGSEEVAKNMQQFFQTSTELVNQLSQFTSTKISGKEDSEITRAKKIDEIYTEATNKGIAVVASLKEMSNASPNARLTAQILAIEEMIQATQNTVYAFREYQKQPSDSYLWDIQDGMMSYILSFEKWYVA